MWLVRDQAAIDKFEERNGMVAVYVDHGYDRRYGELFTELGTPFNDHVGAAWHILIPVDDGFTSENSLAPDHFDRKLAIKIADENEIPVQQLPALLFQFIPENKNYWFSLAGLPENEVRQIVLEIAEIAREEFRDGARDLAEFRRSAHDRVVAILRTRRLLRWGNSAMNLLLKISGIKPIVG